MASSERYSRGMIREGMSTREDFKTGGADSVFTRIYDEERIQERIGSVIVFKPELFDRTDWYTYACDMFGSTDKSTFDGRETPDSMMQLIANSEPPSYASNEQMFRTGIGPQYIERIFVNLDERDSIIADLKAMGLEEFDGRPIEEVIVVREEDIKRKARQEQYEAEIAQKLAEKQKALLEKKQSIMNGGTDYTSDELLDVVGYGADSVNQFKAICDSAIAHGGKEKMTAEIINLLKSNKETLGKYVTYGAAENQDDTDFIEYAASTLGLDLSEIYEQALSVPPVPEMPDESELDGFPTPMMWPDSSEVEVDDSNFL